MAKRVKIASMGVILACTLFLFFLPISSFALNGINPGTLTTAPTLLVSTTGTTIGQWQSIVINYTPTQVESNECYFLMSFTLPGIININNQNYVWDGDSSHIALYQDYDQQYLNNPVIVSSLSNDTWTVTFNSYANGTDANRRTSWNWFAEYIWNAQKQNPTNVDLTTPSYYKIVLQLRKTEADKVVEALSDVTSAIDDVKDTITDIKDYIPPNASELESESDKMIAEADAAAAAIPTVQQEDFNSVEQGWADRFSEMMGSLTSEAAYTYGGFFQSLMHMEGLGTILGITAISGLIVFLIKWMLD